MAQLRSPARLEAPSRRRADAAARAGDDRHLSVQSAHANQYPERM